MPPTVRPSLAPNRRRLAAALAIAATALAGLLLVQRNQPGDRPPTTRAASATPARGRLPRVRRAPVASAARQVDLAELERRFVADMSGTAAGRDLARYVIDASHPPAAGDDGAAREANRRAVEAYLQAHPGAGLDLIAAALALDSTRDQQMFPVRAALLRLSSVIPGADLEARRHHLAEVELAESIVSPRTADDFDTVDHGGETYAIPRTRRAEALPREALAQFLQTTTDDETAVRGTVLAVVAQPEPTVRRALGTVLLGRHPELLARLDAELRARAIDLALEPPPALEQRAPHRDLRE